MNRIIVFSILAASLVLSAACNDSAAAKTTAPTVQAEAICDLSAVKIKSPKITDERLDMVTNAVKSAIYHHGGTYDKNGANLVVKATFAGRSEKPVRISTEIEGTGFAGVAGATTVVLMGNTPAATIAETLAEKIVVENFCAAAAFKKH